MRGHIQIMVYDMDKEDSVTVESVERPVVILKPFLGRYL